MLETYEKLVKFLQEKVSWIFQHYSLPRWMVFAMDSIAVFICFIFAYLLRFNFVLADFTLSLALYHAIITVCIYSVFSLVYHSYTGLLRHTTIIDMLNVFIATTFSFTALFFMSLVGRWLGWSDILVLPLSIIMIHYVLITVILFFVRVIIKVSFYLISNSYIKKKNVLILGAGTMGVMVKQVILSDVTNGYKVSGFLDKNKKLQGKKINGVPVYPPSVLCSEFVNKHCIETLIFAVEEIPAAEKSEMIRAALEMGIEVLETPAVNTWLNGNLQMHQIQKVKIKDLLGRDPIKLNIKRIGIGLTQKTILVTGAAGSIGSEIVRQLTRFNVKKLVLVDQAETPMFYLENELKTKSNELSVHPILADVTNRVKMEHIFRKFKPDLVFHAAAYKHVPLMEENPHEAIRVNAGGTKIITDMSVKYNVKKFVMISTDKAVNPTNVMGASKRICEMLVQLKAREDGNRTQFVITRFGNVLGSNGSVIPIFTKQIEAGGPITVTHPDITRYFMTIPEACELVLEAGFMGKGGEIFVFDMDKPVNIADLARQMIRLSGLVPDKDIKISFTGLRPGEKLYEELLTDQENTLPTHHPKIKIAKVEHIDNDNLLKKIDHLLYNLYDLSEMEVVKYCKEIVPEYNTTNKMYAEVPDKNKSFDIKIKSNLRPLAPSLKILNGFINTNSKQKT